MELGGQLFHAASVIEQDLGRNGVFISLRLYFVPVRVVEISFWAEVVVGYLGDPAGTLKSCTNRGQG